MKEEERREAVTSTSGAEKASVCEAVAWQPGNNICFIQPCGLHSPQLPAVSCHHADVDRQAEAWTFNRLSRARVEGRERRRRLSIHFYTNKLVYFLLASDYITVRKGRSLFYFLHCTKL